MPFMSKRLSRSVSHRVTIKHLAGIVVQLRVGHHPCAEPAPFTAVCSDDGGERFTPRAVRVCVLVRVVELLQPMLGVGSAPRAQFAW